MLMSTVTVCDRERNRHAMKKQSIFIIMALNLMVTPAYAHHLWVSAGDGVYTVHRGIVMERIDGYNPECVEQIAAYGEDGGKIRVERINEPEQVIFKTDIPAAGVTVVSRWGDRVNTTRGKKLISRKEAEKLGLTVISAFSSTQFSRTLFAPSVLNQKPVGMKFEIVPLSDPTKSDPDEPIAFKLLFGGQPLSGTSIFTHDDRKYKTDARGVASIVFEKSGLNLLYAKHQTPPEKDSTLDYLKFMTFLLFEVKK